VLVDLDEPVSGAGDCYATHAKLRPESAGVDVPTEP
jgi:hypothetical protein